MQDNILIKIKKIAEILNYKVVEYNSYSAKLKASGWKYVFIRKSGNTYSLTSFLPSHAPEYRNFCINGCYKEGNINIEKRSINSIVNDIKQRILKDYDNAVSENLSLLWAAKKKHEEIEAQKRLMKAQFSKLGFSTYHSYHYGYNIFSQGKTEITAHSGANGLAYDLSIKGLSPEKILQLTIYLKSLEGSENEYF